MASAKRGRGSRRTFPEGGPDSPTEFVFPVAEESTGDGVVRLTEAGVRNRQELLGDQVVDVDGVGSNRVDVEEIPRRVREDDMPDFERALSEHEAIGSAGHTVPICGGDTSGCWIRQG